MAAAQKRDWDGPSRRRVPRFDLQAPVDVTVVRSGMPNTVPGRSTNLCERGVAAVISGELVPGETVEVEIKLSPTTEPLQMHAIVRYQDKQRCGLEFVAMTSEQKALIREWARDPRLEGSVTGAVAAKLDKKEGISTQTLSQPDAGTRMTGGPRGLRRVGVAALLHIDRRRAILAWRWNCGGINSSRVCAPHKDQARRSRRCGLPPT